MARCILLLVAVACTVSLGCSRQKESPPESVSEPKLSPADLPLLKSEADRFKSEADRWHKEADRSRNEIAMEKASIEEARAALAAEGTAAAVQRRVDAGERTRTGVAQDKVVADAAARAEEKWSVALEKADAAVGLQRTALALERTASALEKIAERTKFERAQPVVNPLKVPEANQKAKVVLTGEVVLFTAVRLSGTKAFVQIDGDREVPWPNNQKTMTIALSPGRHRLVLCSKFKGDCYSKTFSNVSVTAGGHVEIEIQRVDRDPGGTW